MHMNSLFTPPSKGPIVYRRTNRGHYPTPVEEEAVKVTKQHRPRVEFSEPSKENRLLQPQVSDPPSTTSKRYKAKKQDSAASTTNAQNFGKAKQLASSSPLSNQSSSFQSIASLPPKSVTISAEVNEITTHRQTPDTSDSGAGDLDGPVDDFDDRFAMKSPSRTTEKVDLVLNQMKSVTFKDTKPLSEQRPPFSNRGSLSPPGGGGDYSLTSQSPATVGLSDYDYNLQLSVSRSSLPEEVKTQPKKPRSQVVKKTRTVRVQKEEVKPAPQKKAPVFERKKRGSWIFDDDGDNNFEIPVIEVKPVETPPRAPSPEVPPVQETSDSESDEKKRWGQKQKDASLQEELRRQQLAEERRRKAALLYEKLRKRRSKETAMSTEDDDGNEDGPNFDDYNFLARYCIFNKGTLDMFKRTFEVVDEDNNGMIDFEEAILGLRGVNRGLTDAEEQYLCRVLELCGYQVTDGADFKLFSVMCALSQKISSVDQWMKNVIGRIDFKMLDMKFFMCRTLWECNVDPETNTIPLSQLCVELRAGGVSEEHVREVQEKLGHLHALDLLDFLTYIPLFIMVHTSVVDNPLDDSRMK